MNLERFLHYNLQGNEFFMKHLANLPDDNPALPRLVPLMAHILFAQYVWACRIEEKNPQILLSDLEVKPSLEKSEDKLFQSARSSLESLTLENRNHFTLNRYLYEIFLTYTDRDLEQLITYKNLNNEVCTNSLGDIILHVCNHGTHHRAQMALIMRQNDITPPASDYILFARKGLLSL
jgi:uncharacterized damage-inducible protein DinB